MFGLLRSRRLIFRYHNGLRRVWGDPLASWARLAVDNEWPRLVQEAEAGQEPALTHVRKRLVEAFGAEPFSPETGQGLTDWELFELFSRYMDYLEGLKKKLGSGRIPLLIAALSASDDSPPKGSNGATTSGSGSTSTASASSAGEAGR